MKKIISLIVIALLLCTMGGAVSYAQSITDTEDAAAAQYDSTKMFLAYLDEMEINYTYVGIDSNGYEKLNVPNNDSDLGISYTLTYFFESNNENASIRVWDLAAFDESKMLDALAAVNGCHQDWKYVTFVVENDNTITAKMDLIFRGEATTDICWEATLHTVNVIAAAYPAYLGALGAEVAVSE